MNFILISGNIKLKFYFFKNQNFLFNRYYYKFFQKQFQYYYFIRKN